MSARVLAGIVLAAALVAMAPTSIPAHSAPARSQPAADPLAGGVSTTLAPGVTLTELTTGSDASDVWTVHVYVPADPAGPTNTANTGTARAGCCSSPSTAGSPVTARA